MIGTLSLLLQLAGTLLAGFASVCAWRFVIAYQQMNWHRYAPGRHLMGFTKGVAVITSYTVFIAILIGLTRPDFQPTGVIVAWNETIGVAVTLGRALIFGWLARQMWNQLQMLERYQDGAMEAEEGDTREDAQADQQT